MSPETDTVPQYRISPSRSPTLGHPAVGGKTLSSRAPPRAFPYSFVLCLAEGVLFVIRVQMNDHSDGAGPWAPPLGCSSVVRV